MSVLSWLGWAEWFDRTVTARVATVVLALLVGVGWAQVGDVGPAAAWVAHMLLMAWASVVVDAAAPPLQHRWFVPRPWEGAAWRALGVRRFGRLLDGVGWTRVVRRGRGPDGTRAGLLRLDRATRSSEAGHLLCLGATLGLVAGTLGADEPAGAAWLAGLAVVLHVYPVLLQRLVRARVLAVGAAPRPLARAPVRRADNERYVIRSAARSCPAAARASSTSRSRRRTAGAPTPRARSSAGTTASSPGAAAPTGSVAGR